LLKHNYYPHRQL